MLAPSISLEFFEMEISVDLILARRWIDICPGVLDDRAFVVDVLREVDRFPLRQWNSDIKESWPHFKEAGVFISEDFQEDELRTEVHSHLAQIFKLIQNP